MNINEIVQTEGWKAFMGKLYGWGAAVVIVGALFKIQHWPGSGPMLTAGLLTEAFIFFFSAFEPRHAEIDWSLVYPELAGIHDDKVEEKHVVDNKKSALEKFDAMIEKAEIGPAMFEKLGQGLKNLQNTTAKLSDISDASVATNQYVSNLQSASSSMKSLTETYSQSSEAINSSASNLANSYIKVADVVKSSGDNFKGLSDSISTAFSGITEGNKNYSQQLTVLTNNLAALNTAHELQLEVSNKYVKGTEKIYSGVDEIMNSLNSTVEDAKKYKEEVSKLGKNLSALNTIYGNMLSAMNVNMPK